MTPINILFLKEGKKGAVLQQQKARSTNNSMQKLNPSSQNLPQGSLYAVLQLQQFVLLPLEWSFIYNMPFPAHYADFRLP